MDDLKSAAILIIGDEILSGRVLDINSQYIALALRKIGILVCEIRVIPDVECEIVDSVRALSKKHDYLFTTGGIGPTHDDITSGAIAKAFCVESIQHNITTKTENNKHNIESHSIFIPDGSKLIKSNIPGSFGFNLKNVFVMAGVPNVMRSTLDNAIFMIKDYSKMIYDKELTILIKEGEIASILSDFQKQNREVKIGSYPFIYQNNHATSVVLTATDEKLVDDAYRKLDNLMKSNNINTVNLIR